MKFSVLMSVYKKDNVEELKQALLSIWDQQTLKPNQIVLVEDGHLTSSLYAVLYEWEVRLPKIFKRVPLPENIGLGKALNKGMTYCEFEWVFRMDVDDISAPSRFEQQVAFIKNHSDIAIFSGAVSEFSDNPDKSTGGKRVPISHAEILRFAHWRSPFNHMAVAYKKSVVEAVGGYQHHLWMEDYNLWLRILAAGYKSANLPDVLVFVRAGDSMIERRRGWGYVQSEWKLFKLKIYLGFQSFIPALFVFTLRSVPRLLPNYFLGKIYSFLRVK